MLNIIIQMTCELKTFLWKLMFVCTLTETCSNISFKTQNIDNLFIVTNKIEKFSNMKFFYWAER